MSKQSLSLNLVTESGTYINLPDDTPLEQLIPLIREQITQAFGTHEEHLLFVSRRISAKNIEQTLSELGITSGDALHIVTVDTGGQATRLQLFQPRSNTPWATVKTSPATLGRNDKGVNNDIDVSTLLPAHRRARVSRQQLTFYTEHGQWFVKLHEKANAPAFVGTVRLQDDQPVQLTDSSVISIGVSPEQAEIQFNVRLEGI